jgi:hypothetical protein
MLGDSVVGVTRCGGRATRGTWAIAAVGLACLLASAIAFGVSVREAGREAAAREHSILVLHRPAYALRPHQGSALAGGVVFGGLMIGIAALAAALLRACSQRERSLYRIGTAPGVEQPVLGAPSESFPLVAPSGGVLVFNYTAGMDGELIAGGAATPLAELAAAGRALPSVTAPGALEIVIPPAAEIRARVGEVTFRVSSVERPESWAIPESTTAFDLSAVWYVIGSLAAHLALVHVLYEAALSDEFVTDQGAFICHFSCESPEPEPAEYTGGIHPAGCNCNSLGPGIERTRAVALDEGIIARTWQRDERARLAWATREVTASADGERQWRWLSDPGDDHFVPRPRAELAPISYPHSVSGGSLDKAIIKRYVKRSSPQIDFCYEREVLARPDRGGSVSIRFLIEPDGAVSSASGQGFDAAVASCVASVIKGIAFPMPRDGAPVTVSYPFLFRHRSAGPS